MNSRTPASADVLTGILARANAEFVLIEYAEGIHRREFLALGELSMALRLEAISHNDFDRGARTLENAAQDRVRTLRALERVAARRAAA